LIFDFTRLNSIKLVRALVIVLISFAAGTTVIAR
jgi:hypothetical protein